MRKNKQIKCRCKDGCTSAHCACVRSFKACNATCTCCDCLNIFNKLSADQFSPCSLAHLKQLTTIINKNRLALVFKLPCGCQQAAVRALIANQPFQCETCLKFYRYSLCWSMIVEVDQAFHCQECGYCYEPHDWADGRCRRCEID
jgi:hypothetical protein